MIWMVWMVGVVSTGEGGQGGGRRREGGGDETQHLHKERKDNGMVSSENITRYWGIGDRDDQCLRTSGKLFCL